MAAPTAGNMNLRKQRHAINISLRAGDIHRACSVYLKTDDLVLIPGIGRKREIRVTVYQQIHPPYHAPGYSVLPAVRYQQPSQITIIIPLTNRKTIAVCISDFSRILTTTAARTMYQAPLSVNPEACSGPLMHGHGTDGGSYSTATSSLTDQKHGAYVRTMLLLMSK